MDTPRDGVEPPPKGSALFTTTHWSVVLAASQGGDAQASPALEQLCLTYWFPLYAYVRRRGYGPEDAQDLTQEFFAHLLDRDFLRGVTPQKGKFRSFLLVSMQHFLADEWDKARTQKRGGEQRPLALDEQAETRYQLEPVEPANAETLYERQWGLTLLDRVLDRLQQEFASAGKQALFDALRPRLVGDKAGGTYASLATRLDMTEGAVKVAVFRLRRRFQELFREEIARTVADPAEVESEVQHLLGVLRT